MTLDGEERVHQILHRAIGRVQVGIDGAGLNAVHRDATRSEVAGKTAYQALNRRLCQRVAGSAGKRHAITVHGYHDDDAATVMHCTGGLDGGVIWAAHIDVDHAIDVARIELKRIAENCDAGIDDENIETAEILDQLCDGSGIGVAELSEAMGINPPSLYVAFGSKRGLFKKAVEFYLYPTFAAGCGRLYEPRQFAGMPGYGWHPQLFRCNGYCIHAKTEGADPQGRALSGGQRMSGTRGSTGRFHHDDAQRIIGGST